MALKVMGSSASTYYLYNDHLGSTATMSTTGGGTVTGSTARYTPFGDWRTEPTANLTDRGFTGHMHNNLGSAPEDIGLIYMNARWFSPALGRFISADTIVPNPANPQSFNRYSYTINNPLRFIDPSGHSICDSNDGCRSQPYKPHTPPPRPAIPKGPMVLFEGNDWSDPEMGTIQASANVTGTALAQTLNTAHPGWRLSAEEAFKLVYNGSVTFNKTGQSCLEATGSGGCWGRSTGRNTIEVYTDIVDANGFNQLVGDVHWGVHELGHSYVSAVGGFNVGGQRYTLPSLLGAVQGLGIGFPDRPPGSDRYSTWGFAGGRWEWQRSSSGVAAEEFADMYLGWVYGQWETISGVGTPLTEAGSARASFMNTVMPYTVDMAIGR